MKRHTYILAFFLLALLLISSLFSFAQKTIKVQKLKPIQLPKGIKYEGKITNAIQFVDNLGRHIILTTETGSYRSEKFEYNNPEDLDAEIFAYHFLVDKNDASQTWRVYDYIASCNLDMGASFLKNTLQITDLNQNGIAEVWLMYKLSCRGDTSPWLLKIIMYEGTQKYAMRGETKQYNGKSDDGVQLYFGGEYKYDKAFAEGPKDFLKFAKRLWEDNCLERWGEGE